MNAVIYSIHSGSEIKPVGSSGNLQRKIMELIGQQIINKGIDPNTLAAAIGKTSADMSLLEDGTLPLTIGTLETITQLLNVNITIQFTEVQLGKTSQSQQ